MMRRLWLGLLFLVCAPAARAQAPFEGVVTVSAYGGPGQPLIPMTYMAKGARARTEYEMVLQHVGKNKVTMIIDQGRGRLISLIDATKNYTVTDIDKMATDLAASDQPPFVATGRKDTVAGQGCEHYTVKGGIGDMDFCVASGLGHLFFGAVPVPMAGRPTTEMTKQFPRGFFPLKVTGPKGEMLMQVTRIERKRLADALFVPPPGYTELKMGR